MKTDNKKDLTTGQTPGWSADASVTQEEIIANLKHPLGDTQPPFVDEKALNLLIKLVGSSYAKEQGLWDRLDLNVGWILQILKEENPELATKLADDFERFSNTLWNEVLNYNWPPSVHRYGLPENGEDS